MNLPLINIDYLYQAVFASAIFKITLRILASSSVTESTLVK